MPKSRRQPIRKLAEELNAVEGMFNVLEELDIVDEMFDVLLEILEEKGLLSREDFNRRLRERINKLANTRSKREVEFGRSDGKERN
ncbi:MAG: hypothetical protein ACP5IZ_09065 [Thermoprotei archaeon]